MGNEIAEQTPLWCVCGDGVVCQDSNDGGPDSDGAVEEAPLRSDVPAAGGEKWPSQAEGTSAGEDGAEGTGASACHPPYTQPPAPPLCHHPDWKALLAPPGAGHHWGWTAVSRGPPPRVRTAQVPVSSEQPPP